jgi:hypothetical protein
MHPRIKAWQKAGHSLCQIKYALEDGEFLASEGIDQETAEDLHSEVCYWMR